MINLTFIEPISNLTLGTLSVDIDIQRIDFSNPTEIKILGESIADAIVEYTTAEDDKDV